MTFSYIPSETPDNITLVRYHIRDTDEATAMFQDDEITMAVAVAGSVQKAVIQLIQAKRAEVANEPDTTEDWLTVSWRRSDQAWKDLLAEKRREFGMTFSISTTQNDVYRKDSLQGPHDGQTTYTPDYADKRGTDYRNTNRDEDDTEYWWK